LTELELYINTYFGIGQEHVQKLSELFELSEIKKDDFFAKSDVHCGKLSFVRNGYLRVFNYADGKDITQWIISKGEFAADLSSLVFGTPARWNIQAITDCEMYTISSENYNRIGKIVPQWQELEKLFISKCFITLEARVFSFLSMSSEERYRHFFDMKPELFNAVPLHFIASLLGMTPETLSRIRNKAIT
jgi:CRP-like cAMP-binding protein